jgi:tRNA threonylcarbamoyladenosine biosynthesis protein TsaE
MMAIAPTEFLTHSPEETLAVGRELVSRLQPPKLVVLTGDLGAGKTTIIKGIAEGFKAESQENVTSPTFTLIHEYRAPTATVYHIDLYRVDSKRQLETLGIDDLRDERSLILLEWGEKFDRFRNEADAEIRIERLGENDRKIVFKTNN